MSTCIHEMDSVFNRVLRLLTPARILTPSREISVKSYKQWWRLNSLTPAPLTSTTASQRPSCVIPNRSFQFCILGKVSKPWIHFHSCHTLTYSHKGWHSVLIHVTTLPFAAHTQHQYLDQSNSQTRSLLHLKSTVRTHLHHLSVICVVTLSTPRIDEWNHTSMNTITLSQPQPCCIP